MEKVIKKTPAVIIWLIIFSFWALLSLKENEPEGFGLFLPSAYAEDFDQSYEKNLRSGFSEHSLKVLFIDFFTMPLCRNYFLKDNSALPIYACPVFSKRSPLRC
jgi:hypothetical protein